MAEEVGGWREWEYWDGERERGGEMCNKPLRELYPLLSLQAGGEKWGWKDKGVVMRSKPPGSCINFFSRTCVQDGMMVVEAADDSCRPISPVALS